ncbi:FG-GAP-like repeat-containing protein [Cellulomonas sp. H30R-01]|uniref:FG-GAP-like repeat-containing protein n=1 Tax=Cellulomonas sp. H30R-01 TaxID=2704467 RepID=UPI001EE40511|nr:FG-GAP-like repeat-containing protein [Cellulomonas sp. H30R-01]
MSGVGLLDRRVRRGAVRTLVATLALACVGVPAAFAVQGATPTGTTAAATVRLEIGAERACSGALIAPTWVVTAKSCFADATGAVAQGAPKVATKVTVGRVDLTGTAGRVVNADLLVPHAERDAVLVRLASAVNDVAPVKVATTAPVAGESLTVTGYGRTTTQLVPDTAHAATYTVGAVGTATFAIQAQGTGSTICKGDAGGPALRSTTSGIELVAIHSTAYQGGCLGATTTRQDATETRLDNLGAWIDQQIPPLLTTLAAADWSGDAHADVLGVDVRGDVWYYPHNGNGLTARAKIGSGLATFTHVMAADYSGDGKADVVGVDSAGRLWYYPHNGNSLSTPVQIGSGWATFTHVTAGDWNRDGRADILGVDADGLLWVYTNVGLALPSRVQIGSGWGSFTYVLAADYSGDGHADVVGVDSSGRLWYYPHNGPGLSAPVQIGVGWGTFKEVMAADWSGDGRADIIGVDSAGSTWVYENKGLSLPGRVAIPGAPQMR